MATNNIVNVGLSGATGTGSFVGSTSPTLVTPTLGAANATSINFGGGALSTYIPPTSFSPTFSFTTPGNLSVAYATQTGFYMQKGSKVYIAINLVFTPTYTTSAGTAIISNLPIAIPAVLQTPCPTLNVTNTLLLSAGKTQFLSNFSAGTSVIAFANQGSGSTLANMTVANFLTTIQYSLRMQGWYFS